MIRLRDVRRAGLRGGFAVVCVLAAAAATCQAPLRPPAVPLVTHDPYFSVWSFDNRLTDNWSRHWTGSIQAMCGMAMIDKRPWRFAGPMPDSVPAMAQSSLEVTPTHSRYRFDQSGVRLTVTFLSPLIPTDLDLLSRPVTYVTFDAVATDGRSHSLKIYFDATGEWAVNTPNQEVTWNRGTDSGLEVMRIGTTAQPVLAKKGDNLRIDWGWFTVARPANTQGHSVVVSDRDARDAFARDGSISAADDGRKPRAASDNWPVLASMLDMGRISTTPISRHLLLAYDDQYSIELMGTRLKPYWQHNGTSFAQMLGSAEKGYSSIVKRCEDFDNRLTSDLNRAGGSDYADVCVLAYRQCLAASKLAADAQGRPLHFAKENFSNGCISTVDVIYPAAPFFLLFNPGLLKAQLTPVLDYAMSPRWTFPFAPHDLGTYPVANGQVYGGGEKNERDQMPVEESGNMLLMLAALAKIDGNADYAKPYWPALTRWADYLKEKGLDPENQLCTDDFAGHLAHNTNLSLKAILALGGYSQLCRMTGRTAESEVYLKVAQQMAAKWVEMARDGDHYRLTFDKPGTWSQKYNLVWDRILGLNLFPPDVARAEIAYYKKVQHTYGLPLDNRKDYTKLDWTLWSATMADNDADFRALVAPVRRFATESPSRVPLTDWYETTSAKQTGFQARSVVGGVFIKMLADLATWRSWATPRATAGR
jgi:hypothetical protein